MRENIQKGAPMAARTGLQAAKPESLPARAEQQMNDTEPLAGYDCADSGPAMSTLDFLKALYGKCTDGCLTVTELPSRVSRHIPVTELGSAADRITALGMKTNTYYGTALRKPGLGPYVRGRLEDLHTVVCVAGDFDIKGPAHAQETLPESRDEVLGFLEDLDYAPSIIIDSGNGIHGIWLLEEPYVIHNEEELSYINSVSKGFGVYLLKKGREHGWILDNVQDVPRMLRAPGTLNFKTDPPKECRVIKVGEIRYPVSAFEKYIIPAEAQEHSVAIDPATVGSAERMQGKCAFIDYCIKNAETLSEPWWHAFLSIVSVTADGADKAHEWSEAYPGYSYEETEGKYRRAAEVSRPCGCRYIDTALGFPCPPGGCRNCGYNTDSIADTADDTAAVKGPISFCIYSKEEQIQQVLDAELTAEEMYGSRVLGLAAYARESAPFLYECLIEKARKLKIRLRSYEPAVTRRAADLQAERSAAGKSRPAFIGYSRSRNCEVVLCPELAAHVRKELDYLMVQNSMRGVAQLHVYQGGVYRFCNKQRFKGFIKQYVADYDQGLIRMPQIDEVYNQLTTDLQYVEADQLDADEDIINFQNGVLRLSTMELQEHSPDNLSTIQIPCNWNGSEVPTPVFDSYMDTLTDHDEGVRRLLMQFIGVVLSNVKGWRMKKSLFLYGAGDTGKSQLKALVERLLGDQHHIGIDLNQLEARFGTSTIYGKRLAGSSDMSYMTVSELKTFKQCTGGDSIFAEFKGDDPFGFVYGGLLWFCMNRLPKFGGDDGGWVYGRIMAVECRNVIPKEEQDKELLDKMYAEREGIVYQAVMALRDVIGNGYRFDEPASVMVARDEYMADNNNAIRFIQELMEPRPQGEAISHEDKGNFATVMKVYNFWCEVNGCKYWKNRNEFKTAYAEYAGIDGKEAVTKRNGRIYLAKHRLDRDAVMAFYDENGSPGVCPFVDDSRFLR